MLGARRATTEGSPEAEARSADAQVTLERLNAIPAEERMLGNPEWIDFLLYDNEGEIRKSLRPFFPDNEHAQMVVRLPGNQDIETEGAGRPARRRTSAPSLEFAERDHGHHRAPRCCCGTSTTTSRAGCSPSAPSPSGS